MDDDDDDITVAYTGATAGVPVLTSDGTQFGFLEHVLQVPEEDLFTGIVVWVGGDKWMDRHIQRELIAGEVTLARKLEMLRPAHLRFVDAEHVSAITTEYIRCDLDAAQATALPPPATDSPVIYARTINQNHEIYLDHQLYGNMFGRGPWAGNSAQQGGVWVKY
jgi:hypothetical protein